MDKQESFSMMTKMLCIIAGLNIPVPRSLRDIKVAELQLTNSLEDSFITIAKEFQGLCPEYKEALLKRILLEFATPVMGMNLAEYVQKIAMDSADYLNNHSDERASSEEIQRDLKVLKSTIE